MRHLYLLLLPVCISAFSQQMLPPWQEGMLDIHHISTGRGDAAFFVFPDSTTMLVDAGEISSTHPRTLSERNGALRPDSSRTAPEWIVDYIRQFAPGPQTELDYAVVTHFHDDHFGEWDANKPLADNKAYRLTGLMAVGDAVPIRKLLDRGAFFPIDLKGSAFRDRFRNDDYHIVQTLDEYWKFIDFHSRFSGLQYDSIIPGVSDQIVLNHSPERYPNWSVRNIAAGGKIWNGYNPVGYITVFPKGNYPGENPLSVCLKISYGAFDYFTGGDIAGINGLGQADFESMEAQVGPVTGPVDVATLNHHGNRDSQSPVFVRALRPRVWIEQCWSSDHPGEEVLRRITSKLLYPGDRDIFTTDMLAANELVIGDKIQESFRNLHGHVVVRVLQGGASYYIYVLNDFSKEREIVSRFGPYFSR